MSPRYPLLLLSLALPPQLASAQSAPDPVPPDMASAKEPALERNYLPAGPAGRTENFVRGIDFDLQASEDDTTASAQVGGYAVRNDYDNKGNAEQLSRSWSIKLAVPIGATSNLASRSTLDALGDGTKLSFTFSIFKFQSAAQKLNGPYFRNVIMQNARNACGKVEKDQSICAAYPLPDAQFARRYLGDTEINRQLFSGMWRAGVEGSIGTNRFEFIDSATLGKVDQSKPQFSGALFGAYYPSDAMSTVLFRVEYQNAFEAADDAVVCKASVTDPDKDCATGAPTPPKHIERVNLSAEYRRVFETGLKAGDIAISPKATYDTLDNEFVIQLPIYFIPKKTGPFSPGITASYSSATKQVTFGAFMRTTFSF